MRFQALELQEKVKIRTNFLINESNPKKANIFYFCFRFFSNSPTYATFTHWLSICFVFEMGHPDAKKVEQLTSALWVEQKFSKEMQGHYKGLVDLVVKRNSDQVMTLFQI